MTKDLHFDVMIIPYSSPMSISMSHPKEGMDDPPLIEKRHYWHRGNNRKRQILWR